MTLSAANLSAPRLAPSTCRLFIDGPRPGALNMAIDELLLQEAIAGGTTTLRFYQWSEPTLSLGYFQAYADRALHPSSQDCPVVRRSTGGGAILHDQELTYSFATPLASASQLNHSELVNVFHQTVCEVLQGQAIAARPLCCDEVPTPPAQSKSAAEQPFLCFQRRERGDVVTAASAMSNEPGQTSCANPLASAKIVGSAQRRRHGAILQHGSLLLKQSIHAPELKGCSEFGGQSLVLQSLIDDWSQRLAETLAITLENGVLTAEQQRQAASLASSKFASSAWLRRR